MKKTTKTKDVDQNVIDEEIARIKGGKKQTHILTVQERHIL